MKIELQINDNTQAEKVCWCDLCRYKWQVSAGGVFKKISDVSGTELLAAENSSDDDTYYSWLTPAVTYTCGGI